MLNPEILSKVLADAADADKAPEALLLLKDEAEQLFAKYDEALESNKQMTEKVAELRDTNQRLFLRQTGSGESKEEPDEPETPEDAMKALLNLIGGKENNV